MNTHYVFVAADAKRHTGPSGAATWQTLRAPTLRGSPGAIFLWWFEVCFALRAAICLTWAPSRACSIGSKRNYPGSGGLDSSTLSCSLWTDSISWGEPVVGGKPVMQLAQAGCGCASNLGRLATSECPEPFWTTNRPQAHISWGERSQSGSAGTKLATKTHGFADVMPVSEP